MDKTPSYAKGTLNEKKSEIEWSKSRVSEYVEGVKIIEGDIF